MSEQGPHNEHIYECLGNMIELDEYRSFLMTKRQ